MAGRGRRVIRKVKKQDRNLIQISERRRTGEIEMVTGRERREWGKENLESPRN